ncbi:MAG: sigma-70 family RNA polymerase sigma factor [Acidobacteriota bacterium]
MSTTGPRLAYSRARHRETLREISDKELLLALRDHADESALDELIGRKTKALVAAAERIVHDREEARDIVQVGFLRLWEHRDRYDERWSANTWIYRIVTNLAIDQLRSRQSRQKQDEPLRLYTQSKLDNRAQRDRADLQREEIDGIFQELSTALTDKQRAVFLLREIEGMPSKEVAAIVGCRESTVRNHLFNARKILRRELQARYPEYARGRRSEAEG